MSADTAKILAKLQNGSKDKTSLMHDLAKLSGYERPVPSITEFMDSPEYLGNVLMDQDGNSSVYPIWRDAACELYPTPYHSRAYEVYLTGG